MRYTFTNAENKQTTVEIPDAYIKSNCAALHIKPQEAIKMWLSDNGYINDDIVKALTEKAKNAGVDGAGVGASTKKRQAPRRKPDNIKRALIENIAQYLRNNSGLVTEDNRVDAIVNIDVTNIERVIAFTIGNDSYELTLSKKRKAK